MTRATSLDEASKLPVRAFLAYGPVYMLPALLALASTPVVTRALGAAGFGVYALSLTLFALCQPLSGEPTSGSLRRLFAREASGNQRSALVSSLFGLTLFLATLSATLLAGAALLAAVAGAEGLWARTVLATGIAVGVYVVFQYFLTIYYVSESVHRTASWQATHAVGKAGAAVAGALLFATATGVMTAYALVLIAICLVMYTRSELRILPRYSTVQWRAALRYGGPLIVFSIGGLWLANFDRVVLAAAIGTDAAGRYAVAYLLGEYSVFILVTIGLYAVYPRLLTLWESGNHQSVSALLHSTTNIFLVGATTVVAVLAVAGDVLTALIGGPEFKVTPAVPALVAAGLLFSGLSRIDGLVFELRLDTASWARAVLLVSALAVPITVTAVVAGGLFGAAVSTLLCYLTLWVVVRIRRVDVEIPGYSVPKLLTVSAITAILIVVAASLPTPTGLVVAGVLQPVVVATVVGRHGGFRGSSTPRRATG